jgi:hypothetical protein
MNKHLKLIALTFAAAYFSAAALPSFALPTQFGPVKPTSTSPKPTTSPTLPTQF